MDNQNNFICKQCITDYALKHSNNNIECVLKSTLINNNEYYSDDSGINYYSCQLFNDIENCLECTNKETCYKCQNTYTLVNQNKECLLQEDIENNKYYYDNELDIYILCSSLISQCNKCTDRNTCIECLGDAKLDEDNKCISNSDIIAHLYYLDESINKYSSCSKISQCEKCLSGTECISCINDYYLLEGNDNIISCQNIDITKCYSIETSDKIYYIKCDRDITNCDTCSNYNTCTKCKDNFAFIEDDHTKCEDLSTKKYYYETSLSKYKECSYKLPNCETCRKDSENNFICEQCKSNYVFKHDNNLECSLKSDLSNNKMFFSNDSGINYYSCSNSLYNSVSFCKECYNSNTCSQCQLGYEIVNSNTKCIKPSDVESKIIYLDPVTNLYTECSNLISLCYKCENEAFCTECGNEGALEENNTCINNSLVENNNYFLNKTSNKYVSCSIIDNCITCSSSTVCTLCQEGFTLNKNNICQKDNTNNENNSKLSTGAIIGIVFGCVAFLLIANGILYFLPKWLNKQQNIGDNLNTTPAKENAGEIEEENLENIEKVTEPVKINVKSTRRSIHNG